MQLRKIVFWSVVLVGTGISGCKKKEPPKTFAVSGTVKFKDGMKMNAGLVEFRSEAPATKGVKARGVIQADGTFSLKTNIQGKDQDGAVEGEHLVIVLPPAAANPEDMDAPPPEQPAASPINERFSNYAESGLSFTVTPGDKNHYDIPVER